MPSNTGSTDMLGFTVYIKFETNLNPLSNSTINDWSYIVDHLPATCVVEHPVLFGQKVAWT